MARTNATTPADTTMMGVVHDALRRDLARLETALTETPPPGPERRRAIAEHVLWLMDFLHHHHTTEDLGLWPLVRRRNPDAADLLDRMNAELAAIAPRLDEVGSAARRYRADDGDDARDGLVTALAELSGPLLAHLREEESEAMPLVAATISDADWQNWDHNYNVRGKSLRRLAVEGHWLMDGLDPDRYRKLVSLVPPPVRFVIEKGYARRYRRACALRWGPNVAVGRLPGLATNAGNA